VLVLIKATEATEAGQLPSQEELAAMIGFNEELVEARVMIAGEGLQPSSRGKRVRFSGDGAVVREGPFASARELVAGFWIWQVRSMDEAVQWLKRAPFPVGAEIELRQIMESEDLGAALTPELREQEDRQRAQVEQQKERGR